MPQIDCPNCRNQFFADSPGAFLTSAGFAVAGAITCRLLFGHFKLFGEFDLDDGSMPLQPGPITHDHGPPQAKFLLWIFELVSSLIVNLFGIWAFIGAVGGYFIGMAVDHFSRRCPKCGFKQ